MWQKNHLLTSLASLILCLLMFLVAVLCLYFFQESSIFTAYLGILFLLSVAIATMITSLQFKKAVIADRLFNNLLNIIGFSDAPVHVNHKPDLHKNNLGPAVDFIFSRKAQEPFGLSLEQYLKINNFKLNDEILDSIEWKRFELLCHLIWKASGFNSRLTENGADEGVDIRVFDTIDKSKTLYLIQCKKWRKNRKVDRPLLQQLKGQMASEKVEKGAYCTTGKFTTPAREFAAANNIELFDYDKILNSFNNFDSNIRNRILKELLEGDYWTPSCASCGKKFHKVNLKNGTTVWGCRNSSKHGWSSINYYEATPIKNVH